MEEQTEQGTQESLVSQLNKDLQEENSEKSEENKEVEETQIEETQEEQKEELLVTEELAEAFGVSKTFIGQPIENLGKAHKEAVKWGTQNSQQLKELSQQLTDLKEGLSKNQVKDAEKKVEDELGEIPDPVDDPQGFKEYMSSFKKALTEQIRQEARKELENDPNLKTAQELAAKQSEEMTKKLIQSNLPDDVKAEDILNEWYEANKDYVPMLVESGVYLNNPEKLANDILLFYKANSFDKLSQTKDSELKSEIHKKTKENLEKATKPSLTQKSTSQRTETKSKGIVGEMLEDLEAEQSFSG